MKLIRYLTLALCCLATSVFAQRAEVEQWRSRLREASDNDTSQAFALTQLAWAYCTPNPDSARLLAKEGMGLSRKLRYEKGQLIALRTLGRVELIEGRYLQAARLLMQAQERAALLGDRLESAYSGRYLGGAFGEMGLYDRALVNYQAAQREFERLGLKKDVALCLADVGLIRFGQKDYQAARRHFEQALRLNQQIGYRPGEGYALANLGATLTELDRPVDALEKLRQAENLYKTSPDGYFESIVQYHLARYHQKQGNYAASSSYAQRAYESAVANGPRYLIGYSLKLLTATYDQQRQPARALGTLKTYLAYQDTLHQDEAALVKLLTDTQRELQQQQLRQVRHEQEEMAFREKLWKGGLLGLLALAAFLIWNLNHLRNKNRKIEQQRREISEQRDLIMQVQEQLANANLELREFNQNLETLVDRRTSELLRANQQLLRKNDEIKQALLEGQTLERRRVASELHDNLGGLLAAARLSVRSLDPEGLNARERQIYDGVLQTMNEAYREVRLISHNLLPEELAKQGLVSALERLVEKLNVNSFTRFRLDAQSYGRRLPKEIEFNLYNICLELATNILKHAEAQEASFQLREVDGTIELTVHDDGNGLPGGNTVDGMGLSNIRERVSSIRGQLVIDSAPEQGTTFQITVRV